MKNQALFSSKDKSKNIKCRMLQFLFGALMVKRAENKIVLYMVDPDEVAHFEPLHLDLQ